MMKTPSEKWTDSILKYRKKCQGIIQISNNIRYVGVVNNYGKTLAGIINPDVKPLMNSEIIKNDLFIMSTLMSLRKKTEDILGKLNYTLLQHQKMSILIFQKNNATYYVTIYKNENDIDRIITSIKKII